MLSGCCIVFRNLKVVVTQGGSLVGTVAVNEAKLPIREAYRADALRCQWVVSFVGKKTGYRYIQEKN